MQNRVVSLASLEDYFKERFVQRLQKSQSENIVILLLLPVLCLQHSPVPAPAILRDPLWDELLSGRRQGLTPLRDEQDI